MSYKLLNAILVFTCFTVYHFFSDFFYDFIPFNIIVKSIFFFI